MDMERLDRVLRRVRGEDTALLHSGDRDRDTLARLIRDVEECMEEYENLRGRCRGRPRCILTQLWTEESRCHRQLREAYQRRWGETPHSKKAPSAQGQRGLLSALGALRERERDRAEEYRRCSRETADPGLRQMYQGFAAEKEHHAHAVTALLCRTMP